MRQQLTARLEELQANPRADMGEIQAISIQLQEYEEEDLRCACIETENAEHDLEQDRKDAENWDGRGDLMVMTCRQRHLQIEMQSHATIGSLCAKGPSTHMFSLLQQEGVAA